ncbi:MAG TPA: translation initiation factor IF-1 [Candidatus Tyrphobacter sp.]|nr:translation initiation factor IF-1 [Candidatus Tyrphobacter sp.]
MTDEGIVLEALPGAMYRVGLSNNREVLAYVSGKMRIHRIKIVPGDRVKLEMASEKETRGRITRRL